MRESAVLWITRVAASYSQVRLKVQGRIVSEWIEVLERECREVFESRRTVQLDFSGVTFISGQGLAMLNRLPAGKVQIVGCSPLIEQVLEGGKRG